jgi:gas vesicle protein
MKKINKKKVELGLGLLAAATAGAFFLYGTKAGKKERAKIKGWAVKAKGEVLEKLEKMAELDEKKYKQIVDTVSKKYRAVKSISDKEVEDFSKDLKRHWKSIEKEVAKELKTKKK